MLYRRRHRESTWHFCTNCPRWPLEDCEDRTIEPPREALCAECASRVKNLKCDVMPEPGSS